MKKIEKFFVKGELFNVFILLVAIITSFQGVKTIWDFKFDVIVNVNIGQVNIPIFLFVTITTLTAAIVDPIFELFNMNSKKKRMRTLGLGVLSSMLLLFIFPLFGIDSLLYLQSISQRGGLSALAIALLLLNTAYVNYQVANEDKKKILEEKRKRIEDKKKLLEEKQKRIEAVNKTSEYKRKLVDLNQKIKK